MHDIVYLGYMLSFGCFLIAVGLFGWFSGHTVRSRCDDDPRAIFLCKGMGSLCRHRTVVTLRMLALSVVFLRPYPCEGGYLTRLQAGLIGWIPVARPVAPGPSTFVAAGWQQSGTVYPTLGGLAVSL